MFVVTLYVEGGDRDGDTFACGPFESEDEARTVTDVLDDYGSTQVLIVYPDAGAVEREL